ncbi:MAG: archease [Calditrichaeota bacterium]|nr:archease [Calditrichota bacterium]
MYRIIAHTADTGLEVEAPSLEELFREAAKGWKVLVLEDSPTRPREQKRIRLTASDREDLLVQWLSELNFLLNVRFWVMHDVISLQLTHRGEHWHLQAEITGEPFDDKRHYIYFEIKAVTYHQLQIRQEDGTYKTRIIFDI